MSRIIGNMADQFVDQADNIQGELTIEIASHLQCPAFDATLANYHALYPNVIFNVNTHQALTSSVTSLTVYCTSD